MKFLLALSLLVTTSAFAAPFCDYQETSQFQDALQASNIKPVKKSTNPKRYTFVEKQMIHLTVTLQRWLSGSSKEEAFSIFIDEYEGRKGHNAGNIIYYQIAGRYFALVHYYPGENEYGAFFEVVQNGSYRLLADVSDSYITCK